MPIPIRKSKTSHITQRPGYAVNVNDTYQSRPPVIPPNHPENQHLNYDLLAAEGYGNRSSEGSLTDTQTAGDSIPMTQEWGNLDNYYLFQSYSCGSQSCMLS